MQGANRLGKYQGISFREFSRLRYQELAQEAKELEEQEIVAKIIGDWNILQHGYDLQKGKHPTTPVKLGLEIDGPKGNSRVKTTAHKTDQQEQAVRENKEVSSFYLYDKPKKVGKRSGKIRDYITFYRFHSRKLVEAHSTWTSNQISVIIKLLWRKEKMKPRRKQRLRKNSQRTMAGRTAFRFFKLKEGLNAAAINNLWRRLPLESKLAWKRRGNPNRKSISEHNYTLSFCPAKRLQQLLGV